MADLSDIDLIAPADSLFTGGEKINLMRARIDGLYTVLSDITAVNATQIENMGATTISSAQWAYLGSFNQSLLTTDSPTFNGLTLTSLSLNGSFTVGGALTLGGAVAGGDYAWTNVGDMTFHAGSIIASGSSNGNTLLLKANDTTCITLTTGATDQMDLAAVKTLVAIGNLDIGAYTFRCNGLIDDSLTSGRVVFLTTNGQLDDDTDFTFATDTLTATKIGAFQAAGAINFDSQNMTNVDIDSGTIGGVTLDGAIAGGDQSFTNVGNMTFAAGSILASGDTNTNTLLLKANDTTCITLTTAATDQMDLAAVYSLVAINNLDIGAYTFTCAGLIDDTLTSGRVVFASAGGLLADDGDMTFSTDTLTVKKIALNDATTATTDMLTLTPGGAVATTAIWKGIYINGAALDPSGANAAIEGIYVDLSGVAAATGLEMRGVYASVPAGLGYEALHIIGKIKLDNDESTLAAGETATGVDIIVSASGASGGKYHAIDVATTGASSASLAALGTHTGIDVIHQHTGTFIVPTKAWKFDDSGSSYTEVTTEFGSAGSDVTMFEDDDDAIFIGANAAFDEIEVILATPANVDIKPTFWYSTAVTFIQFFPADDTEGFTQDGDIRFAADDLTNFAALSVGGTSKFYIKIIRTKNNVGTDPIEDTIKTLAVTECFWDKNGAIRSVSIAVPTITTVTTFTASGNLDIGAYDFRAATLTADGLTSGRVVFATSNGQLTDDSNLTFSTATLSATNVTSSGTITTAALTATANLDIGAYTFRCNGLIDDSLTSGRVIFATTNGQLADDSDFTFSVATLTIANITSSGTITTAALVATSNLDIGAYNFRAQNLTADNLASGRVVLTSTNGLLVTDSDITFATDTLTVTKIAAFELTGKLTAGATEIEGSAFDINGGTIDAVTNVNVNQTNAASSLVVQDSGTEVVEVRDGGIVDFPKQSGCVAYLGIAQQVPNNTWVKFMLNSESYDIQSEFDNSVTSGTTSATTPNKLVDSGASFSAADDGKFVWNTTDNTYATITAVDNSTTLSLDTDIMESGETYSIYFARFTATVAGVYMVGGYERYTSPVADKRLHLVIRKNGADTVATAAHTSNTSSCHVVIVGFLQLSIGDYVELWTEHNCGITEEVTSGISATALLIGKIA